MFPIFVSLTNVSFMSPSLYLQRFQLVTALDLIMSYYTISFDSDIGKICYDNTALSKYSYKRLPIVMIKSWDIFQLKMSNLLSFLEYLRVYLDDLLVLTRFIWRPTTEAWGSTNESGSCWLVPTKVLSPSCRRCTLF